MAFSWNIPKEAQTRTVQIGLPDRGCTLGTEYSKSGTSVM